MSVIETRRPWQEAAEFSMLFGRLVHTYAHVLERRRREVGAKLATTIVWMAAIEQEYDPTPIDLKEFRRNERLGRIILEGFEAYADNQQMLAVLDNSPDFGTEDAMAGTIFIAQGYSFGRNTGDVTAEQVADRARILIYAYGPPSGR